MSLTDDVRASCAAIARDARWVTIEVDRLGDVEPGPPPALDPERHYLEGTPEDVATYLLTLDAINFGSGWFPTLNKRPGSQRLLHDRLGAGGPLPLSRARTPMTSCAGRARTSSPTRSASRAATS